MRRPEWLTKVGTAENEQGGVMVMTAMLMVILLGFVALGVDTALILLAKQEISQASDAAALAGVLDLPDSEWAATAKAYEYGQRNGLLEEEMSVEVLLAEKNLVVTARRTIDLFFARFIGFDQATVGAQGKAHISVITGIRNTVPLGLFDNDLIYGEQYMLKNGAQPGDGVYKGNFGPLALGGTGASLYEMNLTNGFQKMLRVGDVLDTETGDMAGPTAKAVSARLDNPKAAGCSFENPRWDCPQIVVVPVVTPYESGGRTVVTVKGFAALFLESTIRNGAENYVVGRFLEMVADGESGDAKYYGLRAVKLVE